MTQSNWQRAQPSTSTEKPHGTNLREIIANDDFPVNVEYSRLVHPLLGTRFFASSRQVPALQAI
jgi:hypothetical protein